MLSHFMVLKANLVKKRLNNKALIADFLLFNPSTFANITLMYKYKHLSVKDDYAVH